MFELTFADLALAVKLWMMLTEMGQQICCVTAFRSNFFLACSANRIIVLHKLSLCILNKPKICPDLGFRPCSGVENVLRAVSAFRHAFIVDADVTSYVFTRDKVASRSGDLDEAVV